MTIEAWDDIHRARDWGTCPEPAMARFAKRRFPRGAFVLDVGCGVGAQSYWLAESGYDVWAVDASPVAISRIRQRTPMLRTAVSDACDLRMFPDDHFDAVIDVCCLQHVGAISKALAEIGRVLRPGGWLFSMAAAWDHAPEALEGFARRLMWESIDKVYKLPWVAEIVTAKASHTDGPLTIAHWLIEARKHAHAD